VSDVYALIDLLACRSRIGAPSPPSRRSSSSIGPLT